MCTKYPSLSLFLPRSVWRSLSLSLSAAVASGDRLGESAPFLPRVLGLFLVPPGTLVHTVIAMPKRFKEGEKNRRRDRSKKKPTESFHPSLMVGLVVVVADGSRLILGIAVAHKQAE